MEEKTFTNRDHLLGICDVFEVGMPYEERWSKADAFEGRCSPADVGKSKLEPLAPDPDTEDAQPADAADLLDTSFFEREIRKYRADEDAYKAANSPALVVKLLATDEERRRSAAAAAGDDRRILAEITLKKFKTLPIVKRYMGILAPVLAEADDVRDRILAGWGLTPEVIEQMHAEMLTALEED